MGSPQRADGPGPSVCTNIAHPWCMCDVPVMRCTGHRDPGVRRCPIARRCLALCARSIPLRRRSRPRAPGPQRVVVPPAGRHPLKVGYIGPPGRPSIFRTCGRYDGVWSPRHTVAGLAMTFTARRRSSRWCGYGSTIYAGAHLMPATRRARRDRHDRRSEGTAHRLASNRQRRLARIVDFEVLYADGRRKSSGAARPTRARLCPTSPRTRQVIWYGLRNSGVGDGNRTA